MNCSTVLFDCAQFSSPTKTNGLITENRLLKTLLLVCKYQTSLSLDCTGLECLIEVKLV